MRTPIILLLAVLSLAACKPKLPAYEPPSAEAIANTKALAVMEAEERLRADEHDGKLSDSQGVSYVRVREMKPRGDGTFDAELWQRAGHVGEHHPFYLRLLTPRNTPPMFTTIHSP